jgi:hypothetical protein
MADTTGPTTPVALVEDAYGRFPQRLASRGAANRDEALEIQS